MDMNIKASKRAEIEQFLLDVRAHFRASLETSEYENTSNLFHVTASEQTQELLDRCEQLLSGYGADEQAATNAAQVPTTVIKSNGHDADGKVGAETGCYLEMLSTSSTASSSLVAAAPAKATTSSSSRNSLSASREYIDLSSNPSLNSDKTFRCSSIQALAADELQPQQDQQLYDICQHQGEEEAEAETQQVFAHELFINCPYADLPAGHLALQRSTKYGQLQRIEKRLFFDQSKKYYCGILNDWMLCYADGPTACRPSSSLYLKSSAIEIEHFGEGKRREICFQITTADPSKKFVYQANNEVDAKEWIHAIEAAIRGDAIAQASLKMLRKLPTPPTMKKLSYSPPAAAIAATATAAVTSPTDSIYEEPSPLYNFGDASTPPRLPEKCNSPSALAKRFEYDIPKCPPQPLVVANESTGGAEVETTELLNGGELKPLPIPSSLHGSLALDFQAKVKTVHSELSSQLTSPERLKKAVKKSYSSGNSDTEMLSLTNPNPQTNLTPKEQKKQRKSQSPQASPQKTPAKESDKAAKNWFLSRLNKSATGLSTRSSNSSSSVSSNTTSTPPNAKCKQSEKENLLNSLDLCDGNYDGAPNDQQPSSNPTSPCLKAEAKSKVNMIINQFESSGHLSTMFSVEALAANALASLTSFCESDNCNNYEPIMPLSSPPSSFLKKV
ncbi:uncharacterized protein LOC132790442 isoform X1 [Drosophila nasuta]|uniref:uncharacterized protein LOC132790442 isoform X1 n=1 Tax=Drosophila nasuta TaxID=42062 RepID=UPI00295E5706|nr:uncharacterized protein LOC132790442 isoform X1 [Drosophila nasuta]XP_060654945.1 uncharacterized protein LOC132790442 isoform X1 [Drosophila nasuta]